MKRIPIIAAVLLLSSAAFAEDSTVNTSSSAPEATGSGMGRDWKGFYAGVQSGAGKASLTEYDHREDLGDFLGYGVHFGRLVDHGRLLAGVEIDAGLIRRDTDEARHKLLRFKTVFGVDLGRFAPYGVFGSANFIPDGPELSPTAGLVYGLGANLQVTDRLTLGIEHTRHDLGDVGGYPGTDLHAVLTQFRVGFRF
ncbi:outer membrane beta-barrel protein [Paracoccus methylarcula]|nr:outer membrane beta-barrel protein [Paracoccus methylarcula]